MIQLVLVYMIPALAVALLGIRLIWGLFRRDRDPEREVPRWKRAVDIVLTLAVGTLLVVAGGFILLMSFAIMYM